MPNDRYIPFIALLLHAAVRYIEILKTRHGSYEKWIRAVGKPANDIHFIDGQAFSILHTRARNVTIETENGVELTVDAITYAQRALTVLRWSGTGPWDLCEKFRSVHSSWAFEHAFVPGMTTGEIWEVLGLHALAVQVAYERPEEW